MSRGRNHTQVVTATDSPTPCRARGCQPQLRRSPDRPLIDHRFGDERPMPFGQTASTRRSSRSGYRCLAQCFFQSSSPASTSFRIHRRSGELSAQQFRSRPRSTQIAAQQRPSRATRRPISSRLAAPQSSGPDRPADPAPLSAYFSAHRSRRSFSDFTPCHHLAPTRRVKLGHQFMPIGQQPPATAHRCSSLHPAHTRASVSHRPLDHSLIAGDAAALILDGCHSLGVHKSHVCSLGVGFDADRRIDKVASE